MAKKSGTMAEALAAGDRNLGTYGGIKIVSETIAVRNAGDGLSQAMAFNALDGENDLRLGRHKVYVVLECDVVDHQHPLVKGRDDECGRKIILRAGDATIIDGELVADQLHKQRVKMLEAEEAARRMAGEGQLPGVTGNAAAEFGEDDEAAVLVRAHEAGVHDGDPNPDCELCSG